jgi:hypothetical protein
MINSGFSGNSWASSFWNLFDTFRIICMGAYIAMVWMKSYAAEASGYTASCTNCDENSGSNWQPEISFESAGGDSVQFYSEFENYFFALTTLTSWISFLQYLRFFEDTRILIAYITASARAMIPFMLIIVIMLATFTLTHFQLMRKIAMKSEDLQAIDNVKMQDVFIMQYKLMYGEFYDFALESETGTTTEYLLLLTASLLVPLLMLNLLIAIISEAHAEVVENKVR